ncbi:MAG TPA: response regulator transcription factor [Chloroflexota bacterium]|nr:response regulator transcription factor [Chloroflexota bacterium]
MSASLPRILVVDDEAGIRRFVRANLVARGHEVDLAPDGERALEAAALHPPDLVLLDLMLPGMDGLEVLRRLRAWSDVPIVVLSARGEDQIKVQALDGGADDYLTKPFSMEELLARVRVSLRHSRRLAVGAGPNPVLRAGDLTIDLARQQVLRAGEEIHLTPTELALLLYLARHADRVVTHTSLLQHVWGRGYGQETQYLHVHIGNLRRKLGDDPSQPWLVITEPGTGYRLLTTAQGSGEGSKSLDNL